MNREGQSFLGRSSCTLEGIRPGWAKAKSEFYWPQFRHNLACMNRPKMTLRKFVRQKKIAIYTGVTWHSLELRFSYGNIEIWLVQVSVRCSWDSLWKATSLQETVLQTFKLKTDPANKISKAKYAKQYKGFCRSPLRLSTDLVRKSSSLLSHLPSQSKSHAHVVCQPATA